MIFKLMVTALVCALLAVGGHTWWLSGRVDTLTVQNDALSASVASFEIERDLAREAQDVAEARQKFVEAKAKEYDDLREGILRDGEDADLPVWLFDAVVSLRSGPDDETD